MSDRRLKVLLLARKKISKMAVVAHNRSCGGISMDNVSITKTNTSIHNLITLEALLIGILG